MPWLIGYPREKINWFPTVDSEKCVKCGMCMNCAMNVYEWTQEGPRVAAPYRCIVGCSTCANFCQGGAIIFPEVDGLREIYRREGILEKIRKQLEKEGKLQIR